MRDVSYTSPHRSEFGSVTRIDGLRLCGSGGANRAMEAEFKRVVPRALGVPLKEKPKRVDEQNLRYPFRPDLAWAALHYLRTPSRILWDMASFGAPRLEPLYEQIRDFVAQDAPDGWLNHGLGLSVEIKNIGDFPASPLQVRGTVKNGVMDGARERGYRLQLAPDDPELIVSIQQVEGELVLSLDLVGKSQHRRGYRLDIGEAPLKENLAAQMLMLARWNPRTEALLDPMMGAGTLPVEAALMAAGSPIWGKARPPAHSLPVFSDLGKRARPDLFPGDTPAIMGNDENPRAFEAAEANTRRAKVGDRVVYTKGSFQDIDADSLQAAWQGAGFGDADLSSGLVICNPPYGERLGEEEDVIELYVDLVRWGQAMGPNWRFCFISGHPALEQCIPTQPRLKKPMSNGPLKAHVLVYDRLI